MASDNRNKKLAEYIIKFIENRKGIESRNQIIDNGKAKRIINKIASENSLDLLECLMNNNILDTEPSVSDIKNDTSSSFNQLVAKRNALKEVNEKATRKLHLLKTDISSLNDQSLSASKEKRMNSEEFLMTHRKIALLKLHKRHCKQRCEVYDNARKRVDGKCLRHNLDDVSTKVNNIYFASSVGSKQGNPVNSAVLEPACQKQLRTICAGVSEYLHLLFSTETKHTEDIDVPSYDKNKIWSQIEEMIAKHPPAEILSNLVQLCETSSQNIIAMTENVDLIKDASQLRFQFESGSLTDLSDESSLLLSVKELIEDAQDEHFARFIESEKALNGKSRKKEEISCLQEDIRSAISRVIRDQSNAQSLIHAMELETTSSSMLAGLKYLEETIKSLKKQLIERKDAVSLLMGKYQKISEFEEIAERKQQMIQALVRHNGNAKSRLERQAIELRENKSSKMSSTVQKLLNAKSDLIKAHHDELNVFVKAPMHLLHQIDINGSRFPVHLLSKNRFSHRHLLPGNAIISKLLASAGISDCYSSDEMLCIIKDLVRKDMMLGEMIFSFEQNLLNMMEPFSEDDLERLQELRSNSTHRGNEKISRLLSLCNKKVTDTTATLTDSNELRRIIQSWIDQPAYFLTPWLKEDGMDISKWHQQWSFQGAQLKQLQLNG